MAFTAIILSLILSLWVSAGAVDRYYCPGGSDGNPGTQASPFESLDKLNTDTNAAACGDNFFLCRGGNWTANDNTDNIEFFNKSCTSGNRITVNAYGSGADPILNGGNQFGSTQGVFVSNSDWIDVFDLELQGNGTSLGWITSLLIAGSNNISFQNGRASGSNNECIRIRRLAPASQGNNSTNITFTNNIVSGCENEGIYIGTDPAQNGGTEDTSNAITLSHNDIFGVGGESIETKPGVQNIAILHNYIHDSSPGSNPALMLNRSVSSPVVHNAYVVRQNHVKNITGSNGVPISLRGEGEITHNIVEDGAQAGIKIADVGSDGYTRLVRNNTLFSNSGPCIQNDSGGTVRDNACLANGSGDNTVAGDYANAAGGDFNPSPSSVLLGIGDNPPPHSGALQPLSYLSGTVQSSGTTITLHWDVIDVFQPIQSCAGSASSFTFTCTVTGLHTGQTCSASGTSTTHTVLSAIQAGETCTVSVGAGILADSARIGGTRDTSGIVQNSRNRAVSNGALANMASGEGEVASNLLTVGTLLSDSGNLVTDRGCEKLLDEDAITEDSSAWANGSASFFCEWDLGASTMLDTLTTHCDNSGSSQSSAISFRGKVLVGDPYTILINQATCDTRQAWSFDLGDVSYRFVELTFHGPAAGTQGFEAFLSETPQMLPAPGKRPIAILGMALRGWRIGGQ